MRRDDETRPRPWRDRETLPMPDTPRGSNLAGPSWEDVDRWGIGPTVDDGRTIQGARVA